MARGRPSRATIYERLGQAITDLNQRLGGIPSPGEANYIWSDIWHLEAHHSTALEGNTLVLREVEALLEQKRAVGAKPLKEYMEVQGYAAAAQWVYAQALDPDGWTTGDLLTLQEIRHIHNVTLTPVWQVAPHPEATEFEAPGMFRQHDIHPFDAGMVPPTWPIVPARLQDWIDDVNATAPRLRNSDATQLPEILARLHNQFEQVHPFLDGNGRTGRLLLNLILVRLNYPPIFVLKRQRATYLAAMQRADNGDYGPLGEILARAMYDNINRFIVPSLAGPARLVPLTALVDANFSLAALRQAAQRGRLDAIQGSDGIWRSSRKAVDEYAKTKRQRKIVRRTK